MYLRSLTKSVRYFVYTVCNAHRKCIALEFASLQIFAQNANISVAISITFSPTDGGTSADFSKCLFTHLVIKFSLLYSNQRLM